jgi:parallel beta-helix repeat protein
MGYTPGAVYFVDRGAGKDGNSGESWDEALLTINEASNKCTNYTNDVIVLRGRVTGSHKFPATPIQEINKQGVHLYGAAWLFGIGGGQDSCILPNDTPTGASNGSSIPNVGVLNLGQNDIEVAGLKFFGGYSEMNTDAWMITNDDNRGINHSIHHCMFCGDVDGGAVSADGIGLIGAENCLIAHNIFRSSKYAIRLSGDGNRYSNGTIIRDNIIIGAKYGIYLDGSCAENFIEENIVIPKNIIGHDLTYGMFLGAAAPGNILKKNTVYHGTKGTAYVNNSTGSVLHDCYYGTTTGALTLFT